MQVAEAASVVSDLLEDCPALTVMVTSRVRLQVSSEREHPVTPLPVPETVDTDCFDQPGRSDAIRLFVERAEVVTPGCILTEENAAAIAAICRRLDGLPLAIDMAAAR